MDAFRDLGFPPNPSSSEFKNLGKSIPLRGARDDDHDVNTILRLDSLVSPAPLPSAPKGTKRKWSSISATMGQQEGSSLCLTLGHYSLSSSNSKASSATACSAISSAKETHEESLMDLDLDNSLHLGNEKTFNNTKKPASKVPVDLQLSLSTGTSSESDVTSVHLNSNLYEPKKIGTGLFLNQVVRDIHPAHTVQNLPTTTTPTSSVTYSSEIINQARRSSKSSIKTCQFRGCSKGARGASGRCIAHGGGRRCQKEGCQKGAEGRTIYCKAHGGGRRCEFLGCTKSAEGCTDFCIAHGGGRRCTHEGCTHAARGKSGLCIRHGGGKRCQRENCTKSAEGLSGLCISHGGGRRCQYPECTKGAQGSTMLCKAHGGGKRCTYEGCTKGAEGSTQFCSLKTLLLSDNGFKGSFPTHELVGLENLEILDLSDSLYEDWLPKKGFEKLSVFKKLENLNLGYNSLTEEVLPYLNSLTSLKTLNLLGNGFTGSFPAQSMGAICIYL